MKHLVLKSSNYKALESRFGEWLSILGYAARTVEGSPVQLREFFYYLEQNKVNHLTQITSNHVLSFLNHLQKRKKRGNEGALSANTYNTYITTLNLFATYVQQTGEHIIDLQLKRMECFLREIRVLTKAEIQTLYEVTYEPYLYDSQAMGQRDRAILGLFYGCGLRKSEGSSLDTYDINLNKRTVYIQKGKNNQQRYVPMTTRVYEDLSAYLSEGRYWFLQEQDTGALLLTSKGNRMKNFDGRFKYLIERSGVNRFSTHSLRHSIATHLLGSGMAIEEIAKFLGHKTLESTQLYTHIINQEPFGGSRTPLKTSNDSEQST